MATITGKFGEYDLIPMGNGATPVGWWVQYAGEWYATASPSIMKVKYAGFTASSFEEFAARLDLQKGIKNE